MSKILLICNTSTSVVLFRKDLIAKLKAEGYSVAVVAFDDEKRETIESYGVEFYCVGSSNRSTNPFETLSLKNKYYKIIKTVSPDIVFTFMMKPNIFGVAAAKKAGVKKILAMVEGAGDVFTNNGAKWKLIRFAVCKMYRKSFRYADKVIFLNSDDRAEFLSRKLVEETKCETIQGIGVDLEHFAYKPIKKDNTFLMVARMLNTKGIIEYCEAARSVKQKYPEAVFNYLGGEGTVTVSDIQQYIDDGSVNYLGTTADVRPYLEECTVYVLPSYREGMPISVIEAEATGRAIITCDRPGCRESIRDGYNGFLIPVRDSKALAEKCIYMLENKEQAAVMGENSRKFAEEHFDKNEINDKIIGYLA